MERKGQRSLVLRPAFTKPFTSIQLYKGLASHREQEKRIMRSLAGTLSRGVIVVTVRDIVRCLATN